MSSLISEINFGIAKHKPLILTIGTCLGIAATAAVAFQSGMKAERIIRKNPDANRKDILKEIAVPCILPTAAAATGTMSMAIAANRIYAQREDALIELNNRTESRLEMAKQALSSAAGSAAGDILMKEHDQELAEGQYMFYEPYSGTWFKSTLEEVIEAEYHLNRNFILRGYVSMDEVYAFFNLPNLSTWDMEYIGWSFDNAVDDGYQWIDFYNREKTDENGNKYYIIEYPYGPRYLFADSETK